MAENEVILKYSGEMNHEVLRSILSTMEHKLTELGEKRGIRKKINSILIECIQNQIYYGEKPRNSYYYWPTVVVEKTEAGYLIRTGNLIRRNRVDKLKSYLVDINSMEKSELKSFYQEVLTNGEFNQQGGAGLGFLNIVRKTADQKIGFNFEPATQDHMFFNVDIRV